MKAIGPDPIRQNHLMRFARPVQIAHRARQRVVAGPPSTQAFSLPSRQTVIARLAAYRRASPPPKRTRLDRRRLTIGRAAISVKNGLAEGLRQIAVTENQVIPVARNHRIMAGADHLQPGIDIRPAPEPPTPGPVADRHPSQAARSIRASCAFRVGRAAGKDTCAASAGNRVSSSS
jgi:hypothetical protein